MTPLRIALITRVGLDLATRLPGWWSYAVPEFTVTHYPVSKGFCLSRDDLSEQHDLIVYEDGKLFGTITGTASIPICYHIVDSTLSEDHYLHRLSESRQADCLLIDQDQFGRFAHLGKPMIRFNYCVNDLLMRDWGEPKTVDVACHFSAKVSTRRKKLMEWLPGFCKGYDYTLALGSRAGMEYSLGFNRAKVVVDLSRNPENRPHRTFDVMASRACLVTSPIIEVEGEDWREGIHYLEWRNYDELGTLIQRLLDSGAWQAVADAGYALVMERHTWRVRAAQLRQRLEAVYPQLREMEGVAA